MRFYSKARCIGYPVIALWAVPRSGSTVFERTFLERKDTRVFHEPFFRAYYYSEQKGTTRKENHKSITAVEKQRGYSHIMNEILSPHSRDITFFKDMAFYVDGSPLPDNFFRRIMSTFIIREPTQALISHSKISPGLEYPEEIGYESQWKLFEKISKLNGQTPVVIDYDDLCQTPEIILSEYCRRLNIRFEPASLTWTPRKVPEWQEWNHWHVDAQSSTSIRQPRSHSLKEISPTLMNHIRHAELFYMRMREHSIKRPNSFTPKF